MFFLSIFVHWKYFSVHFRVTKVQRWTVSCDLARKHHISMVMRIADIRARTYCTFHHTSKYKNTCLLQFLLQLEIYGHVHTALFYRISRYKGMCLLHFSPRSEIYRHVPWHIPTALFLTFRDIWARTYCTFHHISRYIDTYLLHFLSRFEIYGYVHTAPFITF